jgi:hypothetical protein
MPNKQQLAKESIHVEQSLLQETVGCQDQVLAAHGGSITSVFYPPAKFVVRPATVAPATLRPKASAIGEAAKQISNNLGVSQKTASTIVP